MHKHGTVFFVQTVENTATCLTNNTATCYSLGTVKHGNVLNITQHDRPTGRKGCKTMKSNYNVQALLDMAQEYLNAENEYRVFCLTFKGGWVPNLKPGEYGEYCRKEAAASCAFYALRSACKVVSADVAAVVGMAKAMNRYEKRERWQVCAHLGWRDEDNARRFLADGDEWAGFFHSTGRRWPCAS